MAHDALFAILPAPTSIDTMAEPTLDEEIATAKFKDDFCVDVRRHPDKRVTLLFGKNENGILWWKVAQDQIVIPRDLEQRVLHIQHSAVELNIPMEKIPIYL